MLLCFFITFISFFLFLKSIPVKPLPPWATEMRLLSLWFWKELSFFPIYKLIKNRFLIAHMSSVSSKMPLEKKSFSSKVKHVDNEELPVLDLPESVLECILDRLPADALCSMAGVCSSLREICRRDYLWEKHMKKKWGRVIGQAAYREWQWHIASSSIADLDNLKRNKQKGLLRLLSFGWYFSWIRAKIDNGSKKRCSLPVDSIMLRYLALENGRFWFPAQVYNRENGHVGFMLSCYDAEVRYDHHTDTFHARYPPHGRRAVAVEFGVPWERLRAPPVDTSTHDLHISDCLNELRPADHIEIQWRRNKEFPYGWWYGVVGHLETCDGNANCCRCHYCDTVVLEFNQYTGGSRWRRTTINRKSHSEEGNEADGFYGGIRKLCTGEEISKWKQLWPVEVLE